MKVLIKTVLFTEVCWDFSDMMCVWYCGSVGFALRVCVWGVLSDSRSHLGVKVSEWLSVSLWPWLARFPGCNPPLAVWLLGGG